MGVRARAGSKTAFWWGDSVTPEQANYDCRVAYGPNGKEEPDKYRKRTTEVDAFPANPWGLHDMGGNLCQWCQDCYGPYDALDHKGPVRMQPAKDGKEARVLRGGCFYGGPRYCRAAIRRWDAPASRGSHIGCRVVSRLG